MITYKDTRSFSSADLERLFLSVDWASGAYPHRLQHALTHFNAVRSAWDSTRLVGLAAAMDDGEMTAYIHYVLVDPAYQGQGIGTELMHRLLSHYRTFLRVSLIAVNEKIDFYGHFGFVPDSNKTPMSLTSLWN